MSITGDAEVREPTNDRTYGDPDRQPGELLTLPEPEAAKRAWDDYRSQNPALARLEAQWQCNAFRRAGYTNVRVVPAQDDATFVARLPMDATGNIRSPDLSPHGNKAAGLCRKMTGILTADPPAAEAVPGDGEEQDEDATEFTNRALSGLDESMGEIAGLTDAIDRAHNFASVFRRYWFNPQAGERMPVEAQRGHDPATGEVARHVDEAEHREVPVPPDPAAVEEAMAIGIPPPEPTMTKQPWPAFKKGMVTQDGRFTDQRKEAAHRVVGEIQGENLTGNNVRLIPHTARDITEARGAQIAAFTTWGELRTAFPDLATVPDDTRNAILSYKPKWAENAYPAGQKKRYEDMAKGQNTDEKPVLVLTTYMTGKKDPAYPLGLYMVQAGEKHVLHRSTLSYTDEEGVEVAMMLPLSQLKLFTEGRDHPYGVALMEIVGPGGEVRNAVDAATLDALDRITSAKTFLDARADVQPAELYDRTKRYISTNMMVAPVTEQVQGMPAEAQYIRDSVSVDMDDASGLQETGRGLENSNVSSGIQAMTVVSQVQAALSPQSRAVVNFYLRGCTIRLELVKAHFTIERQLKWSTEDGRYKQKAWSRTDIGSTADVKLKAGTMSLMNPAQKAAYAQSLAQMGLMPPDELRDALESNTGGTLALQSDEFRLRIRRQISDWKDGPPPGWAPPQPPIDPMTGLPAMTQAQLPTGQMVLQPVTAPPDPALAAIFTQSPSDLLPAVAQIRLHEMAKLSATTAYERKPAEWRAGLDAEMMRMQQVVQAQMMASEPQQQAPAPAGAPQQAEQGGTPGNGLDSQHEAAQAQHLQMPVGAAQGGP